MEIKMKQKKSLNAYCVKGTEMYRNENLELND